MALVRAAKQSFTVKGLPGATQPFCVRAISNLARTCQQAISEAATGYVEEMVGRGEELRNTTSKSPKPGPKKDDQNVTGFLFMIQTVHMMPYHMPQAQQGLN